MTKVSVTIANRMAELRESRIGKLGDLIASKNENGSFLDVVSTKPELSKAPSITKKAFKKVEYRAELRIHNFEKAMTIRDAIFAQMAKEKPSAIKLNALVSALNSLDAPLHELNWGVDLSEPSVKAERVEMMIAVQKNVLTVLDSIKADTYSHVSDDTPTGIKFSQEFLEAVLNELKKGVEKSFEEAFPAPVSNPPPNVPVAQSARQRSTATASRQSVVPQPPQGGPQGNQPLPNGAPPQTPGVVPQSQGVRVAQPAQRTAQSLQLEVLKNDLETFILLNEHDSAKTSEVAGAWEKLNKVIEVQRKADELAARVRSRDAGPTTTTPTTSTTTTTTSTTTNSVLTTTTPQTTTTTTTLVPSNGSPRNSVAQPVANPQTIVPSNSPLVFLPNPFDADSDV